LIALRKIHRNHEEITQGRWSQEKGSELFGKTIGLLGFGNIGQKLATLLQPFNCKIVFFDKKIFDEQELKIVCDELKLNQSLIQQEEYSTVLREADILSIHLPLSKETQNIISAKDFYHLKESVSIINTARGSIVDERDLHTFLSKNLNAFAAFDVYAIEPALENPLFDLPNFFGTSHRSSLTNEGIHAMGLAAIAGLDNNRLFS